MCLPALQFQGETVGVNAEKQGVYVLVLQFRKDIVEVSMNTPQNCVSERMFEVGFRKSFVEVAKIILQDLVEWVGDVSASQ